MAYRAIRITFQYSFAALALWQFLLLRVAIINFNGQKAKDINVNSSANLCTSPALISVAHLQEPLVLVLTTAPYPSVGFYSSPSQSMTANDKGVN